MKPLSIINYPFSILWPTTIWNASATPTRPQGGMGKEEETRGGAEEGRRTHHRRRGGDAPPVRLAYRGHRAAPAVHLSLCLHAPPPLPAGRARGAAVPGGANAVARRAGAWQDVRRASGAHPRGEAGLPGRLLGHPGGAEPPALLVPPVYDLLRPDGFFKQEESRFPP